MFRVSLSRFVGRSALALPQCFNAMGGPVAKRSKIDGGSEYEAQTENTSSNTWHMSTHKFAAIVGLATFVDKTLFIKAFLEADDSVIVPLAPRRFGKSTNMDMIIEFVSGNKKLFEDNKLKIYEEERNFFIENCKENPVIHVDFKCVGGKTEDEVLNSMKTVIRHAYGCHQYLVKQIGENWVWSDDQLKTVDISVDEFVKYWKKPESISRHEVIVGLKHLSWCLHAYHGKPAYVFINEYDAPIMQAIMQTEPEDGIVDETINLINNMTVNFLTDNKHVKKGLINACVQMPQAANDLKYYEFLRAPKFAPYFGFTDKEVKGLLERDEFVTLKNDDIQKWYNGYKVMHTNEYVIYSGYSILEYLQKDKPKLDTYWVNSEDIINTKELFVKGEIRKLIEDLINDEKVEITTIQRMSKVEILTLQSLIHGEVYGPTIAHAHLFLQFLSENGYLNVVKCTSTRPSTSTLRVPNEEIKQFLQEKCYSAGLFEREYDLDSKNSREYVEALCILLQKTTRSRPFGRFAKAVSNLFREATLYNEEELHNILFTLAYNFKLYEVPYELSVQRIKRRGRPPHILVVLGDVGMIIAVKFGDESSEMAHAQLLEEGYVTAFNDYKNVTDKILLGLHMKGRGNRVTATYTVNNSTDSVTINRFGYKAN